MGSFGIDFLAIPDPDGGFDVLLSEINLRLGGTTHPHFMARFVTEGTYDPATGCLFVDGSKRSYVASDNLRSDAYIGLTPRSVIAALEAAGLAFQTSTKTGATLHLLAAVTHYGKMGVTCIAESEEAAQELYEAVVRTLDDLARRVTPTKRRY